MRLFVILMAMVLFTQVHYGQIESNGHSSKPSLKVLNNYKHWARSAPEQEVPETETQEESVPLKTYQPPSLRIHPNKRARFAPRKKIVRQDEREAYERSRERRNGKARPQTEQKKTALQ